MARAGNGSIELFGDRTRFVLGDLYSPASNLGFGAIGSQVHGQRRRQAAA